MRVRSWHVLPRLAPLLLLNGCAGWRLFNPVSPIANTELQFTIISTSVMMLIIAPTTFAVALFAWRYRKSNQARYDPEWSHSLPLEIGMWGVPLAIVLVLAYCTYRSAFLVNPPAPTKLEGTGGAPLDIDVITTDWQWVFVYPQQKIATIDDLVVPQGQDVLLRLTSATVVNDFYVPQVATMMDVMPGMRTWDAFRIGHTGTWQGYSTNFSGDGYSWMEFATRSLTPTAFAAWVKQVQASPRHLDFQSFQNIAQPKINLTEHKTYFSNADPNLFEEVYDSVRAGAVYPVSLAQAKASVPAQEKHPVTTGSKG